MEWGFPLPSSRQTKPNLSAPVVLIVTHELLRVVTNYAAESCWVDASFLGFPHTANQVTERFR